MNLTRVALLGLLACVAACSSLDLDLQTRSRSSAPARSAEPSATSAAGPVASQPESTDTPGSSPAPIGAARIPFANRWMEVSIVGRPGIVVAWRAATEPELGAIDWGSDDLIALARLDERRLVLGWIGTVCDVEATLTIEKRSLVVTPAPRHGCDLVGVGRGLVLKFASDVDPRAIDVTLGERVLLP